jgi:hypothetical protein
MANWGLRKLRILLLHSVSPYVVCGLRGLRVIQDSGLDWTIEELRQSTVFCRVLRDDLAS